MISSSYAFDPTSGISNIAIDWKFIDESTTEVFEYYTRPTALVVGPALYVDCCRDSNNAIGKVIDEISEWSRESDCGISMVAYVTPFIIVKFESIADVVHFRLRF